MRDAYKWIALSASVGLALSASGQAQAAIDPVCGTQVRGGNVAMATYQVQPGASTTVDLGRGDSGEALIPVIVNGCRLTRGRLPLGFTERFLHGSQELPLNQIHVERELAQKQRLLIYVRVERGNIGAGTYKGTLDLDNAESYGKALAVPVTVTAEERPWPVVLTATLAVALVGGFFLLWLQSGETGKGPMVFTDWLGRFTTWVAVGFGVAGAIGVWWKRYLDVATWTWADFTSLIALMVVAFTGTAAVAAGAVAVGSAAREAKSPDTSGP